jgi:hypothetical protein
MEQIKVEEAEWAHEECRCKSIAIDGLLEMGSKERGCRRNRWSV